MNTGAPRRHRPAGAASGERPQVDSPYAAHPLLDPFLPGRAPEQVRRWNRVRRQLPPDGNGAYDLFVRAVGPHPPARDLADAAAACLRDVDNYLDDVLRFAPPDLQDHLRPRAETRSTNHPARLLRMCFDAASARLRYEAQRKLYLGRLLFSIDHWRGVRDGPRHRAILADHLEQSLLGSACEGPEREVCYRFTPDESTGCRLTKTAAAGDNAQCWRFRPRNLPAVKGWPAIEIFHHQYRFKRDAIPTAPDSDLPGELHLGEAEMWPKLGRRSGSILSKMIRKGITDPHQVQDVLGARFIVADRRQAYALEQRLLAVLGGPAWARDRTNTLTGERDRILLSKRSAVGFEVLKETVDILVDDTGSGAYHFGVELQIYPLESYLATIHDAHYASHASYKRRQFQQDILPVLFPEVIFSRVLHPDDP